MGRSPRWLTNRRVVRRLVFAAISPFVSSTMISPGFTVLLLSPDRIVDSDQLGAVRKGRLYLDLVDHFGHAFHYLIDRENRRSELHRLRHAHTVARRLQDLR